jgi:hypothetical protein
VTSSLPSACPTPATRPTCSHDKALAYVRIALGSIGTAIDCSKVFMGSGLRMLFMELFLDGDSVRFALVATMPFLFCVSLVSSVSSQSHGALLTVFQCFSTSIITNLSMVVSPVTQFHENSKYYSAVKPKPNKAVDAHLPHVTIQMPVYKESLSETM